ncbi:MAG: MBL fold metallo-hydrolase [Firmicutes bacterium]|jgi:glyoxylase-like metal-dependent hydrolase (beta-lactamase superfamily II)|nr:MBL fold metallo-hydrolase [Bacillota bacterium]
MASPVELIPLAGSVYVIPGNPNVGVITCGPRAVLIDTGGDRDRGRALLRALTAAGLELAAVALTHSHADHMGGCAYLVQETGVPVYAPDRETAFVEHPLYESSMLLSGAAPWKEMSGKFLLATPVPVSGRLSEGRASLGGLEVTVYSLPGHSMGSIGLGFGEVLFAGDAVFAPEVLQKFAIPYNVDMRQLLESHAKIRSLPHTVVVPGHGDPASPEIADANRDAAAGTIQRVLDAVAQGDASSDTIVARVCDAVETSIPNPAIYYLYHAGALACLSYLFEQGLVKTAISGNRVVWVRCEK